MQTDHQISQQRRIYRGCSAGERSLQFERTIEINSCIKQHPIISLTNNQQSTKGINHEKETLLHIT